jgi:ribosome-associated heat shock protein Hsp15
MTHAEYDDSLRLDKWLWAARFFKTRSLAAEAVSGGKVHYKGQRVKPSRSVEIGAEVQVTLGPIEKVVIVRGLSAQRRPAPEAAKLYEETEESRQRREAIVQQLKDERAGRPVPVLRGRPTKRDRRRMDQLTGKNGGNRT